MSSNTNETGQDRQTEGKPLTRLDRLIISVGHGLSLAFLVSALIIVIEIVARYVFNSPTFWVHETTTLLCAVLFIYGGSHCLAHDKHIRIGLIYGAVSPRAKRRLDIVISVLSILYAATFSWAAYLVAQRALFTPWGTFRLETSGSAWDPPLPAIVKTVLLVILVLMLVQLVLHLIHHIRREPDA